MGLSRTGLLGGAFDPPHVGHLALAECALERFSLERLLVVVTGDPPHKAVATPAEIRLRLAEAAFAEVAKTEVSRFELDRPGPSYTVDTVQWARERFGSCLFVVGADEFADFLTWHDPEGVLDAACLAVATRPGYPRQRLEPVLTALTRPERVTLFEIPAVDVSSTEVRERVARGESIEGLVPPAVASLIEELALYRRGLDPQPSRSLPSVEG